MKLRFSYKFVIDSDKEPFRTEGIRIGNFGGPGSGKSFNNALIAEQFLAQGGTVVIFENRSEFHTLKEKFDLVVFGGVYGKDLDFVATAPKTYAKAVVEDGISMIFYVTDVEDEDRLINFMSRFINHLLKLQEVYHRPILIILEEGHKEVPLKASGHVARPWVYSRMINAFLSVFQEGRKLNIIAIISSQRPQLVNFSVRMLCNITFFGKFAAQDIKYVERECLKPLKERGIDVDANRLLDLKRGEWLVISGATAKFEAVTQKRVTKHGADTPKLKYIAPRTKESTESIKSLSKVIREALEKEETEKSELEKAKRKIRGLLKEVETWKRKAEIKLAVREMLKEGVSAPELVEKLAEAETTIKALKENLEATTDEVGTLTKKVAKQEEELQVFYEFQAVFRKMNIFPEREKVIEHPAGRPLTKAIPKTCKGLVQTLWSEGWFREPKRLGDVSEEIRRRGFNYNAPTISATLIRFVRKGVLTRDGRPGKFRYAQRTPPEERK